RIPLAARRRRGTAPTSTGRPRRPRRRPRAQRCPGAPGLLDGRPGGGPRGDPRAGRMAAVSSDRPDDAGHRAAAASGPRRAPATTDPVRVRRARIARWSLLANRVGYLLFGLAVALFVVAFVVGFTGPLVTAIV